MAENVYEGMFIFDTNRYARDPQGVGGLVDGWVGELGGEMLASRLWEERRLAYPIKGQKKGTYWLTYFRLDPSQLTTLNRQSQINDSVLRHLVLKVDPRLVEALVSHAQAVEAPAVGASAADSEFEDASAEDESAVESPEEMEFDKLEPVAAADQ